MNITSICFTGHRSLTATAELKKRLYDTLEALVGQGATFTPEVLMAGICFVSLLCLHSERYIRT